MGEHLDSCICCLFSLWPRLAEILGKLDKFGKFYCSNSIDSLCPFKAFRGHLICPRSKSGTVEIVASPIIVSNGSKSQKI